MVEILIKSREILVSSIKIKKQNKRPKNAIILLGQTRFFTINSQS